MTADHRHALTRLDRCLVRIEDAMERGDDRVTAELANTVGSVVPAIKPAMPLSEALDMVFLEQAALLGSSSGGSMFRMQGRRRPVSRALGPELDSKQPPLSESEARNLTEAIKSGLGDVCELLLEAHCRRAWSALGCHSWAAYVAAEFGISRSRSYELLDQARVRRALATAASITTAPTISAFAAAEIKPILEEVANEIGKRAKGLPRDQAEEVISIVVREARMRIRTGSEPHVSTAAKRIDRLATVMDFLADLPPGEVLLGQLSDEELALMSRVSDAAAWLGEFADAWTEEYARRHRVRVVALRTNQAGTKRRAHSEWTGAVRNSGQSSGFPVAAQARS